MVMIRYDGDTLDANNDEHGGDDGDYDGDDDGGESVDDDDDGDSVAANLTGIGNVCVGATADVNVNIHAALPDDAHGDSSDSSDVDNAW